MGDENLFDQLKRQNRAKLGEEEYSALRGQMRRLKFNDFLSHEQGMITLKFLKGQNVFGVLPTSGGKSFTFQTVARLTDGITIVISPLISLMKDQTKKQRDGLAVYFNSELSREQKATIRKRIRAGKVKLLYISPERLKSTDFKELLSTASRRVERFVIDEAHCVVEWGYNFRVKYLHLAREIAAFEKQLSDGKKIPILLLTATASPWLQKEIVKNLQVEIPRENFIVRHEGAERPELQIRLRERKTNKGKVNWIVEQLSRGGRFYGKRGIIFSTFADGGTALGAMNAETVYESLLDHGIRGVGHYHGGMDLDTRRSIQEEFESGRLRVLVATKAFGMGVDLPKLDFIIHLYPPLSLEEYWQEAGRGGRGMNHSHDEVCECTVLYGDDDRRVLSGFPNLAKAGKIIATFMCATRGEIWLATDDVKDRGSMRKVISGLHRKRYIRKLPHAKVRGLRFERWKIRKSKKQTWKLVDRLIESQDLETKQTKRLRSILEIWLHSNRKMVRVPENGGVASLSYYNKELNWFTEPEMDALELQDDHIREDGRFTCFRIRNHNLTAATLGTLSKKIDAFRQRGYAKLEYVFEHFLPAGDKKAKQVILSYLSKSKPPA